MVLCVDRRHMQRGGGEEDGRTMVVSPVKEVDASATPASPMPRMDSICSAGRCSMPPSYLASQMSRTMFLRRCILERRFEMEYLHTKSSMFAPRARLPSELLQAAVHCWYIGNQRSSNKTEVRKVPSSFSPFDGAVEGGAEGDILKRGQQCKLLKSAGFMRETVVVHFEIPQGAVACKRCNRRRVDLRWCKRLSGPSTSVACCQHHQLT